MFEGLTVGMCVAFGAGIMVGAGAGIWATSAYYESAYDDYIPAPKAPFDFANILNRG